MFKTHQKELQIEWKSLYNTKKHVGKSLKEWQSKNNNIEKTTIFEIDDSLYEKDENNKQKKVLQGNILPIKRNINESVSLKKPKKKKKKKNKLISIIYLI